MDFSVWQFLIDVGVVSFLLLLGVLLRVWIPIFQKLFLPASIIAGLLGLLLGPSGVDILPFSDQISAYPGMLIAVVFACLPLLGPKFDIRKLASRIGSMFTYSTWLFSLMWALCMLITVILLQPLFSNIHDGFGLVLAAGFVGGHGTAAAIGESFANYGWEEATSLGMTSATVGIICSIVIGMLFIKNGAEKGKTSFLTSFKDLPDELRTGLIPKHKRESSATETVSPMNIDPLALHIALVAMITALGYFASKWIEGLVGSAAIPVFSTAFLVGLVINFILSKTNADQYLEKENIDRINGTATDVLVVFGIASIQVDVVAGYIGPLLLLFIFGILYNFVFFKWLAPHFFKTYAFEKGLFSWGWGTGTVAMGIALLRVVDPKMQSEALDDYGIAYIPESPIEILVITFAPLMAVTGQSWTFIAIIFAWCAIIYAIARKNKWLNTT
ncbi:sodium/glutamate symporter [Kurthia huakuii]|uniref:sodium/glutamate symporter n=1 Tax=Kurthia huakuii TaxID=1421019 RepID=UPI0004B4CA10|nr:sodium/glutamate symporter [Kurthia huakuii]MBM7700484.1 ESS family glutamate:Na+ symporter [Kurthia huakuii]